MGLPSQPPFVTVWDTTKAGSASNKVILPLFSGGTYSFCVNWGDGTSNNVTAYNDVNASHSYTVSGTYTIAITGVLNGWKFGDVGDKLKITEIRSWGQVRSIAGTGQQFYGCANLNINARDVPNFTGATWVDNMFRGCTSLTTPNSMNNWDMKRLVNFNNMFKGASNFNANISAWNTSSANLFVEVFGQCVAFNQNIGGWNTAGVTSMDSIFAGATSFNQNISAWNVGAVTNLMNVFNGATAFNQNIGSWNTGSATRMDDMFNGATSFNQNIGSWNMANVTAAPRMFNGVTLTNAVYNGILVGWAVAGTRASVTFSGGNSHYDSTSGGYDGVTARAYLTGTKTWTITDGGTP